MRKERKETEVRGIEFTPVRMKGVKYTNWLSYMNALLEQPVKQVFLSPARQVLGAIYGKKLPATGGIMEYLPMAAEQKEVEEVEIDIEKRTVILSTKEGVKREYTYQEKEASTDPVCLRMLIREAKKAYLVKQKPATAREAQQLKRLLTKNKQKFQNQERDTYEKKDLLLIFDYLHVREKITIYMPVVSQANPQKVTALEERVTRMYQQKRVIRRKEALQAYLYKERNKRAGSIKKEYPEIYVTDQTKQSTKIGKVYRLEKVRYPLAREREKETLRLLGDISYLGEGLELITYGIKVIKVLKKLQVEVPEGLEGYSIGEVRKGIRVLYKYKTTSGGNKKRYEMKVPLRGIQSYLNDISNKGNLSEPIKELEKIYPEEYTEKRKGLTAQEVKEWIPFLVEVLETIQLNLERRGIVALKGAKRVAESNWPKPVWDNVRERAKGTQMEYTKQQVEVMYGMWEWDNHYAEIREEYESERKYREGYVKVLRRVYPGITETTEKEKRSKSLRERLKIVQEEVIAYNGLKVLGDYDYTYNRATGTYGGTGAYMEQVKRSREVE